MAADITGSTILRPMALKVENGDIHGKNWTQEIVKLAIGAANDSATYTLATTTTAWPAATVTTGVLNLSAPLFCTIDGVDDLAGTATAAVSHTVTYGKGTMTITWTAALTSRTIRLKIEGWA